MLLFIYVTVYHKVTFILKYPSFPKGSANMISVAASQSFAISQKHQNMTTKPCI